VVLETASVFTSRRPIDNDTGPESDLASDRRMGEIASDMWHDMQLADGVNHISHNEEVHSMLSGFGILSNPAEGETAAILAPGIPAPAVEIASPAVPTETDIVAGRDAPLRLTDRPPAPDPRMERVAGVAEWLRDHFAWLDPESTGILTIDHLEQAMMNPALASGDNAANLVTLYNNYQDFLLAFEQPDGTAQGITREGVQRFLTATGDDQYLRQNERQLAVAALASNFDLLTGGNPDATHVTTAMVERALQRTDLTPEQRGALADLRAYQEDLRRGRVERIPGFGGATSTPDPEEGQLQPYEIAARAPLAARVIQSLDTSLTRAQDRLAEIRAPGGDNIISQGVDGTCSFIAAAIAVDRVDPQALANMITDNGDGTSTVTFPGDPDHPQIVDNPTEAMMANWGYGRRAAILEAAFAQHLDPRHRRNESLIPAAQVTSGFSNENLQLLTGRNSSVFRLSEHTLDQTHDLLVQATTANSPLIGDTTGYQRTPPGVGLVNNHSYTIVGYDAVRQEVILQNPARPTGITTSSQYPHEPHHFNGTPLDGVNDGRFRIPLAQFHRYFNRVVSTQQ